MVTSGMSPVVQIVRGDSYMGVSVSSTVSDSPRSVPVGNQWVDFNPDLEVSLYDHKSIDPLIR
jgi:hypothetical protein